ncbi:hypothetical protein AJ79_07905 [Helicocarpus griseus UAMH5409]|uniref:Fungal N-terminal domain-containing protein n=1 Tax=Helicocarpus griseus UAMH5409 TaxID=1447875 RepID=A0A2B7WY19_9EURO|nr:hypothetical protein AJ79_07905 [Helicocarpus griseus UAMH5409]
MEPVTAIGLLASISALLKASKESLDSVKSFKHALKNLADLVHDLEVFDEALRGFDRVLRSRQTKHNISEKILRTAVNDGSATLKELERRVTQVYKIDNSGFRRIKFVQNKSHFEALGERIRSQSPTVSGSMLDGVEEMVSEPQLSRDISGSGLPLLSRYPSSSSSSRTAVSLGSSTLSTRSSICFESTSATSCSSFDNTLSKRGG